MNKARDSRKNAKKSPVKSLKEKRADKHQKKDIQQHPEFMTKPVPGQAH